LHPLVERLRGGLIVSCQASASDVLYGPQAMANMAKAAELGGAVGIRANGAADISAIRQAVSLPILGIYKQDLPGLGIRITPSLEAAREIVEAGATLIALDATKRGPLEGRLPAAELIRQVKDTLHVPVMADIATLEEGIAAAEAGADIVASTLSGYTAYTVKTRTPDFELVRQLVKAVRVPVIAEGRIATPDDARRIFELGGFAVVIGSMVTRPRWITEQYVATLNAYKESRKGYVVALDIGGTKIASGVIDPAAQIAYHDEVPTQAQEGGAAILKRVGDAVERAIKAYPDVKAIGISTGGNVDASGTIIYSVGFMPGWAGTPLGESIAQRFGLPTVVENDGHAATLGEALHGAGRGYHTVLGLTVGTGVGGGLVVDGKVYAGSRGTAMMLGHIALERDGRPCTCGLRGCLESYVSGPALIADYNARVPQDQQVASGQAIAEAAQQGDQHAVAAIETVGSWLGYGLGSALNLLDPSVVVIGGGVTQIGDLFLNSVRRALQQYAYAIVRDTPVLAATLGPQAGLIGAAALARQHLMTL